MTPGRRCVAHACASERLERRTLMAATVLSEVVTDFGASEFADGVVVQRDGRAIVLGHTENDPAGSRFFLARYDVDGTLDETFGEGGRIAGEFPDFRRASALAVDRIGRLYVAGVTDGTGGGDEPTDPPDPAVAVARFTRSGFLDRAYGAGGIARAQAGVGEVVNDVAVDASGRAVVAGQTLVTSPAGATAVPAFMAVRFEAFGQPDLTFGGVTGTGVRDGVAAFPVGVGESGATSVAIDRSGEVLLGGFGTGRSPGQSAEPRFAVARLERTGVLDDDFGGGDSGDGDGIVTLDVGLPSVAQDLAIGRGGTIVAAGNTLPTVDAPGGQVLVARFDRGGAPDPSFGGGDGFATSAFAGARSPFARGVAIDARDRVLLAGEVADAGEPTGDLDDDRFLLARYLPDGTPDATFGPGGAVLNEVLAGNDSFEEVAGLALQRDGRNGRVVVAGNVGPGPGAQDLAAVRYATDATPGAGSARLNGRKLVVKGTDRADVITVAPGAAGALDVTVNGTTQSFPLASVSRVEVGARDGDDEVTSSVGGNVVSVLLGGDDDDDLRLLGDARGRLDGDDGHDDLTGADRDDRLRGGDGDDLLFGGAGDDDLDGGDGFDELYGEDGSDDLKADDGFADDLDGGGGGDDDATVDFLDFYSRVDDVRFR